MLQDKVEHLVVQNSDTPLLRSESVHQLMARHIAESNDMTLLTYTGPAAQDLGRVLRDARGRVVAIVEASEWPAAEEQPEEVNSGLYCFVPSWLGENLERIESSPKGESCLTSLAAIGAAQGASIQG